MDRVDEAGSPPAGLYKSTDRGQTWTFNYAGPFNTSSLQVRVSVSNGSPQTIYALLRGQIGSNSDVRFAASTNGGATRNHRPGNGVKKSVWDYVAVDPSNANTVYVGVEDLYKTTDGGANWINITGNYSPNPDGSYGFNPFKSNSHPDHHGIAFSPSDSNVIYIGTDGGVYRSGDGGGTFQSLNNSLTLTEFYGITLHPTNPAISYGGAQDNG